MGEVFLFYGWIFERGKNFMKSVVMGKKVAQCCPVVDE